MIQKYYGGILMERIWLTGYRSYELNVFNDTDPKVAIIKETLRQRLKLLLESHTDEFWLITGPQMGAEQWGIEVAAELKADYSQLKIAMMMPFAEFGKQWNEQNQLNLANAKAKTDFCRSVSNLPYQSPQQLKNYQQFMLTHTDRALLIYDDEHPGKTKYDYQAIRNFQSDNDYDLQVIDFAELQEMAEEWEEREREQQAEKYEF